MPGITSNLTVDDLHDRSVLPVWHRVCGRRLQQMTVGHARMLDALGLWTPKGPHDLLLAVFVCSMSFRSAIKAMDSRLLVWRLRWLRWRLGPGWEWSKSLGMWFRFVRYHREEPYAVARPSDPSKPVTTHPVNTPWIPHMRAFLCAECGYSPETFDDQLLGQAVLDYYATLEAKDSIVVSKLTRSQMLKRKEEANGK